MGAVTDFRDRRALIVTALDAEDYDAAIRHIEVARVILSGIPDGSAAGLNLAYSRSDLDLIEGRLEKRRNAALVKKHHTDGGFARHPMAYKREGQT